ncbi:MAG: glucose 1-dehydrogenase [Bryobacteraceae bacterium]|nr:glucose 1-dehydrogenase [Bryobacteraceae bacterium]
MDRLNGKTAIVTGGANGIGQAVAQVLAEEGAQVLVCDIDSAAGEVTAAGIRAKGGVAVFCRADVSAAEDAVRVAAQAQQWTGRIDILVNNAAYLGNFHGVLDAGEEEWNRCIQVALMGAQRFTQAVLPAMLEQRGGSIVNVASVQAVAGCPTSVAYTATKAALLGFTLSAAYDYGPHNIRVNAVNPGPIQTRISPKPGEPAYEWQRGMTMLGRVGYPREVAWAVLFLASEEASFITGATLAVDGGWAAK